MLGIGQPFQATGATPLQILKARLPGTDRLGGGATEFTITTTTVLPVGSVIRPKI
jgi:hypothetical protein